MKEQIQLMTNYSLWADQLIAKRTKLLSEAQLDQKLQSSFPTIRHTLAHIYDAYLIWMKRLEGVQMTSWPSQDINPFTIQHYLEGSRQFLDYTDQLNEHDLNKICTYSNSKGKEFSTPFYGIILHAVNHGTYHRGQIVTMLRTLGEESIPQTDLIAYLRL